MLEMEKNSHFVYMHIMTSTHCMVQFKSLPSQQKEALIQLQHVYFIFFYDSVACVHFSEIMQCSELMGMKTGFKQKQSL